MIHECVDLGLSVKWATCNVGASVSESQGILYSWGEKDNQCYNSEEILKRLIVSASENLEQEWILNSIDDIAHITWGVNWHIPTYREFDELYRLCNWRWTYYNGVYGYIVKSLVDLYYGNFIFLPCGTYGRYWSSSYYKINTAKAKGLSLDSYNVAFGNGDINMKMMIRPVCI